MTGFYPALCSPWARSLAAGSTWRGHLRGTPGGGRGGRGGSAATANGGGGGGRRAESARGPARTPGGADASRFNLRRKESLAAGASERPRRAGWRGHRCPRPSAGAAREVRDVGRGGGPLSAGACGGDERGPGPSPSRLAGTARRARETRGTKAASSLSPESALSEVPGRGRLEGLRRGLSASLERRVMVGGIGGVGLGRVGCRNLLIPVDQRSRRLLSGGLFRCSALGISLAASVTIE